jgi:two-component system phosphate regulon sensor histidine kinase PhoR
MVALFLGGIALGFAWGVSRRRSPTPARPQERVTERAPDGAFDRLIRALPLGVVMLDRGARVMVANRAAGTVFGFDPVRAVGLHLIQIIPNVELERRVDEALEGEASLAALIVAGKTGNRTYAVSAYPLDDGDTIAGALVLADDQTEFLALERARQDFLSNVSHELRTPLSSIKLMLETVVAAPGRETADLFLPQALAQVDRLVALVMQLLDQARVQSGQLSLHLKDVDLEEALRPIVASFEPQAVGKGVSLELQPSRLVRLQADPDRLAQVFVNLIDNALRHTPTGGTVRVEADADENDAVVRISDDGMGIPFKDLPHVFERFYVVDRSRARDISGAGLGLSIVKQIIDAHGGSVSVESMLGNGATFTVRLPIARLNLS